MASGKGVRWKNQFFKEKDVLTYLDMPIMIKYQPVRLFNVQAGPDFGYLLSAKQNDLDNGQKADVAGYYSNYDVALAFGIEANLPAKFNLTIRYVLGLKTVTKGTDVPWKNNFFQISAGYRIFGR
jgi:hypothetical protein